MGHKERKGRRKTQEGVKVVSLVGMVRERRGKRGTDKERT